METTAAPLSAADWFHLHFPTKCLSPHKIKAKSPPIVRQDVHQGVQAGCRARLEAGVSLAEVSRGLEVSSNVLHRWVREFRQAPGNAFPGQGQRRWSEGRVAELERKIGQQAVEIDFF